MDSKFHDAYKEAILSYEERVAQLEHIIDLKSTHIDMLLGQIKDLKDLLKVGKGDNMPLLVELADVKDRLLQSEYMLYMTIGNTATSLTTS